MDEVVVERGRRVGENTDGAVGLLESTGLRPGGHPRDPLLVPVRGPEITVIHGKGKAAGPAGQAGELPAADESIGNATGVASDGLSGAERQLSNPVGIDLVGCIEVGKATPPIEVKGIHQAASGGSYIYAGAKTKAGCGGSDIDRLGVGVV